MIDIKKVFNRLVRYDELHQSVEGIIFGIKYNANDAIKDIKLVEQVLDDYNRLKAKENHVKPYVYTLFLTDGPRNHMWNREISENRCGSCDKKIDRDFAFCPYCGQAIDWSEAK